MKTVTIVVALVIVSGGGWIGYTQFLAEKPAGGFITKPLARGDIVRTVAATGTIEPLVKVIVGSQVSGSILKWSADFNAEVKAGEILAKIDPARFQTTCDQAKANLALARANEEESHVRFKDAERERIRIENLRAQHNASENELLIAKAEEDAARAAWHGAQAGVESATALLGSAEVDLERAVIRSPIDGVVIARNIEDGQTVAASLQAPELFVIANDLKRMQVNANVSESDIGLIREGGPASFRVDAYPARTFDGSISQIRYDASAVDGVVTYVTLIEVHNDDLALRPGMTANVTFEVAKAEDVICIPNAALRFDPTPPGETGAPPVRKAGPRTPTVYLLAADQLVKKEIRTGLSDGKVTELRSGDVKEDDVIILDRNWGPGGDARKDMIRTLRRG